MWESAWPRADADAVSALYAPDATFFSQPFRTHEPPASYVAWAFGEQEAAECRFGSSIVDADRAAVDWWAVVTARDGSVQTIAGTSLLRFDTDGLVVEQRDSWNHLEGRHELHRWAPRQA